MVGIGTPPAPASEPITELRDWDMFELSAGRWHFVGTTVYSRARVSGVVLWFDVDSLSGATASGRVYHLAGEPGVSEVVEWLWQEWCKHYRLAGWRSVAEEVWHLHVMGS